MPYTDFPVYPTETLTLTDFPNQTDDIDVIYAWLINALKYEMIAVQDELGTLPKGSYADVKTRLDALAPDGLPPPIATGDILYVPDRTIEQQFTTITHNANGQSLGNITGYNDKVTQGLQVQANATIRFIQINIMRITLPGDITVRIETDNAGEPSGTLIDPNATATILETDVPLAPANDWVQAQLNANVDLSLNTQYWLVLQLPANPGSPNFYQFFGDQLDNYAYGKWMYHPNGGSWTDFASFLDAAFKLIAPFSWDILPIGNENDLLKVISGKPAWQAP